LNIIGDWIVETILDISCPGCNHKPIKYNSEILDIPYFDQVLSTTIICDKCNYKYSNILITSQNLPMEHKFKINSRDDMSVRIIKSSTATIEIPELRTKIEPRAASEAYISNIEGVLVRVSEVIAQAGKFTKDHIKIKRVKTLLRFIDDIRSGNAQATIIIKDPQGNSAIISKKTQSRELTNNEIAKLETGMMVFDLQEIDKKNSEK
jgi:zinc finger protein